MEKATESRNHNVLPKDVRENFKKIENGFRLRKEARNREEEMEAEDQIKIALFENEPYYVNVAKKKENIGNLYTGEIQSEYLELIVSVLRNYQVEKGSFEHYFQRAWKNRSNNISGKIAPLLNMESLDAKKETQEGDEQPLFEIGKMDCRCTENTLYEAILEIGAVLCDFYKSATCPQKEKWRDYFSLFYTETVGLIAKETSLDTFKVRHEKNIFQAVCQCFLDFYMTKVCHHLKQIQETPMRTKGWMGLEDGERGKEEIAFPFHGEIYRKFSKERWDTELSSKQLSMLRRHYKDMLEPLKRDYLDD